MAVAAAGVRTCALRVDGTATCWGEPLTVSPPRGVQFV